MESFHRFLGGVFDIDLNKSPPLSKRTLVQVYIKFERFLTLAFRSLCRVHQSLSGKKEGHLTSETAPS